MIYQKTEYKFPWHKIAKGILILVILLGIFANTNRLNIAVANSGAKNNLNPSGLEVPDMPDQTNQPTETMVTTTTDYGPLTTPTLSSTSMGIEPTPSEQLIPPAPSPTNSESEISEVNTLLPGGNTIFLPLIITKTTYFYVSPSGSDQNPGSFDQPWKTIQKAANTVTGGDTIYIRGGTYNERVSLVNRNNSSGLYITFTNYSGESVILDGTKIDIQYGGGLFHIEKTGYIRVSGLKVQHSNGAGIYVLNSNNIRIDHNYTYDTVKSGIGIWRSSNVVVDSNDIALACNAHPDYYASEENISIAASSSNVEVKNNYVHQAANIPDGYAGGEGINVKDGAHDVKVHHNIVHLDERTDGKPSNRLAFGLDGWQNETYNVSFYSNIAYNNRVGFVVESEAGATARDIYVYNNIAYNNGIGFYIPDWAQNETSLKKNIYFINNTSYKNTTGIYINSIKIENIIIRNNIFWQDGTPIRIGTLIPQSQIVSDHNLTLDPKFVNPDSEDFHLQINSPAINTGSSLNAPNIDFDGNPRPQDGAFDIGAFEYLSP